MGSYLKSYQPVFTCWKENIPGKISWTTSDVPDKVNDRIPEGGDMEGVQREGVDSFGL